MKALVISDRPEIIDYVTPLLKEKGFDIIHYRWIIKALDNIEEIQPDVIVLSAGEYPRHWKTLSGFVQSGIGGNDVKMYLYETTPLSDEDQKKAEGLGVLSFDKEFTDIIQKDAVEACQVEENISADENDDELIDERLFTCVEVAYNNPSELISFCNGKYYEEENLIELDVKLDSGFIKYVSIYDGNEIKSFSANVENVLDNSSNLRVSRI